MSSKIHVFSMINPFDPHVADAVLSVTKKHKPIRSDYKFHGHVLEQVPSAKYSVFWDPYIIYKKKK